MGMTRMDAAHWLVVIRDGLRREEKHLLDMVERVTVKLNNVETPMDDDQLAYAKHELHEVRSKIQALEMAGKAITGGR
jgi:hypothetical protein